MIRIPIGTRREAVNLRKKGFTYSEIYLKTGLSKGTLSSILSSVKLESTQRERIEEIKRQSRIKGGTVRNLQRNNKVKSLKDTAQKQIRTKDFSSTSFLMLGAALYWAEGSKEKSYKPGSGLRFSNSDARMIRFFVQWLVYNLKVETSRIVIDLYVHESKSTESQKYKRYWMNVIGINGISFGKIYLKHNKLNTKRKNTGDAYRGLVRVKVSRSSDIVRMIEGWVERISDLGDRSMVGHLPLEQSIGVQIPVPQQNYESNKISHRAIQ